ncbi:MAG: hypothetical protein JWQ09_5831 [Segetibacter sp.]|nr:hypothetical protein [Segetibacter sp.]
MDNFDFGYVCSIIDAHATFAINYNKVNEIRGTYDPTIQICIKSDYGMNKVSNYLKEKQIPHSIKSYTTYRLLVITSIYTINEFIRVFGNKIQSTERYEVLKEFVFLRVSKNMVSLKSRYGDEEVSLWRKMRMLGKKSEFLKAERIS